MLNPQAPTGQRPVPLPVVAATHTAARRALGGPLRPALQVAAVLAGLAVTAAVAGSAIGAAVLAAGAVLTPVPVLAARRRAAHRHPLPGDPGWPAVVSRAEAGRWDPPAQP